MPSLVALPCTSSRTRLDTQIPPASANPSRRAATFIPSPWMLAPSTISPTLRPILNDLPIWRYWRIPLGHCALDLHRAMQGVHGTDEQDQQAVASCPYDPTSVLLNLG